MNCYHCGAETTNGLALCELCRRKVETDLEFLPVYFRNLARWRPGRAGSRPVPGSRVLYRDTISDGSGDRIWRALDEAGNDLTGWARKLADDRGLEIPNGGDNEAEQAVVLCGWLRDHLTSIATLEWCGEFMRSYFDRDRKQEKAPQGIGHHERQLRELTEAVMPGWYAGACRVCTLPTHVVPGLTWVTCTGCGTTTYARDHLDVILVEARPWVARPKRLAEAIVALVDTEQSVTRLYERIKKWGTRGRIPAIREMRVNDFDSEIEAGPKRFRLGDVLDRLSAEGSTRLDARGDERIGA